MIIKYSKKIRVKDDCVKSLASTKQIFIDRNVRIAQIINNTVEFESKSMFKYFNFHLFSYVDFGKVSLIADSIDNSIIEYKIVSYRIWFLVAVGFIMSYYAFQFFWFSIAIALIILFGTYLYIKLRHFFLFKRIVSTFLMSFESSDNVS